MASLLVGYGSSDDDHVDRVILEDREETLSQETLPKETLSQETLAQETLPKEFNIPEEEEQPEESSTTVEQPPSFGYSSISWLPEAEEFCLPDVGTKRVTSAASVGDKLVIGGVDGVLRFWNWSVSRCFKHFVVSEGHGVTGLFPCEQETEKNFLCCTTDAIARILDSSGATEPIQETARGDQYVRMAENTYGHTAGLTGVLSMKDSPSTFATSSLDGTVRLWRTDGKKVGMDQRLSCLAVLKCLNSKGVNAHIFALCLDVVSHTAVAGCSDGSIQIFSAPHQWRPSMRPTRVIRPAHSGEIIGAQLFPENKLVTRGSEGSVKIWDIKTGKLLHEWVGLGDVHCNLVVVPGTPNLILTGGNDFNVLRYDPTATNSDIPLLSFRLSSPVSYVLYLAEFNQILCGGTDGRVSILYDKVRSRGGVLTMTNSGYSKRLRVARTGPVMSIDELLASGEFKETRSGKIKQVVDSKWEKRTEELARRREDAIPEYDHLTGYGRVDGPNIQQALVSHNPVVRSETANPLDYSTEVATPAQELLRKKRYCPRCGLKICTCGYMREERDPKRRQM